jgi:GT2 family glycosyltransferase
MSRHSTFVCYKWWIWSRFCYHFLPDDALLTRWNKSEWPEYQQWIDKHSILTFSSWSELHQQANITRNRTFFSIVAPVHNTDARILEECILSVRMQTNPYWELILVNDASSREETMEILNSEICKEPRIRILNAGNSSASGISAATNLGIKQAGGDYIIFLDHDDRLAPEAIHYLSQALSQSDELDILYSDRDMISPDDKRFMHLMKPDWSPENLLSGNYIFHLMCYKKSFIMDVGGLRSAYDGSQDYDLILRCMEHKPNVGHIQRVLYHWRQHIQSIAMNDDSKSYVFDAGIRALEDALKRRGISASVRQIESLWQGNYHIQLPLPESETISRIYLPEAMPAVEYSAFVLSHPALKESTAYLLICSSDYQQQSLYAEQMLASWLELENVGMACGKLLDKEDRIVYAGMFYADDGQFVRPYCGYPANEPGYMAVTSVVRNISLPNPFCVLIKRDLWQQLSGFREGYQGLHAMLDFAFRAQQAGWRIVFDPMAIFSCEDDGGLDDTIQTDIELFQREWEDKLINGDPYYSPNLSQHSNCYELNLD